MSMCDHMARLVARHTMHDECDKASYKQINKYINKMTTRVNTKE